MQQMACGALPCRGGGADPGEPSHSKEKQNLDLQRESSAQRSQSPSKRNQPVADTERQLSWSSQAKQESEVTLPPAPWRPPALWAMDPEGAEFSLNHQALRHEVPGSLVSYITVLCNIAHFS